MSFVQIHALPSPTSHHGRAHLALWLARYWNRFMCWSEICGPWQCHLRLDWG